MKRNMPKLMEEAAQYLRYRYPAAQGWELSTNVNCGGAITDMAVKRTNKDNTEAIPVMVVAGNWVTPIYGHILHKWKTCAQKKGIHVPEVLLLANKGTLQYDHLHEVTYTELENNPSLRRTG